MGKRVNVLGYLFAVFLVWNSDGYAQKPVVKEVTGSVITVSPPKKQLESLGWPNDIINSVAIHSSKGIILVDTQNSPMNGQLIKKTVTEYFNDTTFVYVINTHGHSCHSGGNIVFDHCRIVGQVNSIEEIRNYDDIFLGQTVDYLRKKIYNKTSQLDSLADKSAALDSIQASIDLYRVYENDLIDNYKPRIPDITFEDRLMLGAGNISIELFYMGMGHSNSDLAVYIPEEKVLCSGNLFHLGSFDTGAMPSFYLHSKNDIEKWISTLDEILKPDRDIKYVLTTHGKHPFKRRDLEFIRDYCKEVYSEVKRVKSESGSLNDLIELKHFDKVIRSYSDVVGISKTTEAMHARNMGIIWDCIK